MQRIWFHFSFYYIKHAVQSLFIMQAYSSSCYEPYIVYFREKTRLLLPIKLYNLNPQYKGDFNKTSHTEITPKCPQYSAEASPDNVHFYKRSLNSYASIFHIVISALYNATLSFVRLSTPTSTRNRSITAECLPVFSGGLS